jgi:hypothetical protein
VFERLKEKWGVKSNTHLMVIFIVFAITGSASMKLGEPILEYLALTPERFQDLPFPKFWYYTLRLILIFPLYQVLLIVVGSLFLQQKFFWAFEKKMFHALLRKKKKKN